MADVIGLSDVSTPDTGKGSQLKTGGRRKHNMPNDAYESCIKRARKDGMKNPSAVCAKLKKSLNLLKPPRKDSFQKGKTSKQRGY